MGISATIFGFFILLSFIGNGFNLGVAKVREKSVGGGETLGELWCMG